MFNLKLNNNFYLIILLSIIIPIPSVSFAPPVRSLPKTKTAIINNSPKEVIDQVWQIIYRDYLDASGDYNEEKWKGLRKSLLSKSYANNLEGYEAIKAMLSSLNDPYTRFLTPKEFNDMRIDTSGELTGVGIQLSLDKNTQEIVVVSPIEGTPASRAGVKSKDIIVFIDDVSTKGMTIENAVNRIRGKRGTKVKLGLRRESMIVNVLLVRDLIEIHSVESRLNSTQYGFDIGYIRLKQFNANASKEMKLAIKNLEYKNVYGYVLDLRSNPGGLLESSIDIARQWLNEGTVVSTQTRDGIKDIRRANGRALTNKPVIVLVNEGSASASEILSGAIQDNGRGRLVGEKTFGKGLVQSVRALSDGSGLTVTIAKYLTPKGRDIHLNGIKPDIVATINEEQAINMSVSDIGTIRDSQYKVAENLLVKMIRRSKELKVYEPRSTNLIYALN